MTGIAGVDEVGRGCLAGPVFAAAVILKPRARLPGLNDSKKLSREQRETLAPRIEAQAIGWAVASASVEEIDEINILRASLLAMSRALAALSVQPLRVIVDGIHIPEMQWTCPAEAVVEGDGKYREIMAASVLAKVARDAHMRVLDAEFPGYGFAQHKGYGTAEHQDALKRLGPSKVHRKWFAPVVAQQELFALQGESP